MQENRAGSVRRGFVRTAVAAAGLAAALAGALLATAPVRPAYEPSSATPPAPARPGRDGAGNAAVTRFAEVAANRTAGSRPVAAAAGVTVPGLDGTRVAPLAPAAGVEATVLLFVMTDCPISNRYAPEIRRLHDEFAGAIRFWLVYVDAHRPAGALREHRASFGYPFAALRDADGALAALAGATVTPEAAVFDAARRLVYRGRIDDRFVAFGVARRAPRTRDLRDRLRRIVAGETLSFSETRAVGCYIPGA